MLAPCAWAAKNCPGSVPGRDTPWLTMGLPLVNLQGKEMTSWVSWGGQNRWKEGRRARWSPSCQDQTVAFLGWKKLITIKPQQWKKSNKMKRAIHVQGYGNRETSFPEKGPLRTRWWHVDPRGQRKRANLKQTKPDLRMFVCLGSRMGFPRAGMLGRSTKEQINNSVCELFGDDHIIKDFFKKWR